MSDAQVVRDSELLLGLLVDALGEWVAGEVVTGKLDLAPAQLYRAVEALRGAGYRVDAGPKGWRLLSIPDRLTRLELAPLLATHDLGARIEAFDECGSTNEEAQKLAKAGAAHGTVVIAERQSAGKGRRGRAWSSLGGHNLALSVVLRPELPPQRAPELTLVCAVAVAEALVDAGVDAGIKWPNDVEADGRKLAGILTELGLEGGEVSWVVVGIGVNLNATAQDFPAELHATATSASIQRGEPVHRALFTAALLTRLEEWLDVHEGEGFEPIRERWSALSTTLGRQVHVLEHERVLAGEAEELDETGALLVRDAQGQLHVVSAGDIVHLRTTGD